MTEQNKYSTTPRDYTHVGPVPQSIATGKYLGKVDSTSQLLARDIRNFAWAEDTQESIARFIEWCSILYNFTADRNDNIDFSVEQMNTMFSDVIKELSKDKDYHSLPEIAGARRGYKTLIESLNNLTFDMFNTNLGKVTPNMVSDELLAQIAGTAPVLSVVEDGSLTTAKLADGAVTPSKMYVGDPSPNVLNKDSLESGFFWTATVGQKTVKTASANWYASQFIPVSPGDVIRFNRAYSTNYYIGVDANDIVRSVGAVAGAGVNAQVTASQNVVGFYTAIYKDHVDDAMITINNEMPVGYMPYTGRNKQYIGWLDYENNSVQDKHLDGEEFQQESENILLTESLESGGYYNGTLGEVATQRSNPEYSGNLTPIPVEKGDTVYFSNAFGSVYFIGVDSDNIARQIGEATMTDTDLEINVSDSVTGFYTAVRNSSLSTDVIKIKRTNKKIPWVFIDSDQIIDKEDMQNVIMQNVIESIDLIGDGINSPWFGKNAINFGTSISWQDGKAYGQSADIGKIAVGWQSHVGNNTGMTIQNEAVSGSRLVGAGGTRMRAETFDFSPYDAVFFEIATNDFRLDTPLGTLGIMGDTDFSTGTFYGGYRHLIEYVLTSNPEIKIILFTPLQRDNSGYDVNTVNGSGHKLYDYVQAIREIGEMYSLQVIDLYKESGFNKFTLDTFTMDGLHPNDLGYARMGDAIIYHLG